MAVAQRLLHAIASSQVIDRLHWFPLAWQTNLHRPIDMPFSVTDDTGDPPEGLELLQSPFGDPVNQFAVGVVERDVVLH
jgi:hypothetical protein